MIKKSKMIADILIRGLDDWVSLAEVVSVVSEVEPSSDSDRVKRICVEIIRQMLTEKLVSVGDLVSNGAGGAKFQPWDLDIESTMTEFNRRWEMFHGPFDKVTGDFVCWLLNTPAGNIMATQVEGKGPST